MTDFQKIDKFEVTGKLGQGSFGVVYKGRDPFLKRDVAIKVCTVDDAGLRQRFFREAEIAGRLEHRNIVSVFALGFEGGVPFLVQEFLEGEDLRQALERGALLSGVQRLDILLQIAEGLAYAHEQGVIHRDVKPANIRLVADGRVKVIDFGIAKLASDESQLTQKGVTMGTASYLPPEQVRGGETDHRADIFSFGVLAYELFSGERPFRGKTISALVYQILYKPPLPMAQHWPECPQELAEVIGKCLEKQPEARFANLRELIAAFSAIRDAAVAGRLQALHAMIASGKHDLDNTVSGDLLSQSMISRTAKEVSGRDSSEMPTLEAPRRDSAELPTVASSSGAYARSVKDLDELPTLEAPKGGAAKPGADKPGAAKPGAVKASAPNASLGTQRVPLMAAGASAFAASSPVSGAAPEPPPMPSSAATQRLPMPVIPESVDPVVEFDELATSAHEISRLVAEGNLSGAMEQLEETMNRQRGGGPPPPLPTAAEAPSVPLPTSPGKTVAPVDEFQPTTILEVDPKLRQAKASAAARPPSAAPPSVAPPPPLPPSPLPPSSMAPEPPQSRPAQPVQPVQPAKAGKAGKAAKAAGPNLPPPLPSAPPAALPSAPASMPRPAAGGSKLPLLLGVGALAFVLLAVLGFFLLRGNKASDADRLPPLVIPGPQETAPTLDSTQLAIAANPWGVVTEIVDAEGKILSVPTSSATPLLVTVAGAGTYTVTVTRPDSGEKGQCTATVEEGALVPCQVLFTDAGATANEFFKESGWWK